MQEWGATLRNYYNKSSNYRENDFTLKYLGYWTDNGYNLYFYLILFNFLYLFSL